MTVPKKNPVEAHFREAQALAARGRLREALLELFLLFNLDCTHRKALAAAARIMTHLRDVEGARLVDRLARDPTDPEKLYAVGHHFVSMNRPDAARPFLEACLQRSGRMAEVLYELAFCNFLDRKFERAADILEKTAGRLSPRREIDALLLRVESLLYAGRTAEGARILKEEGARIEASGRKDAKEALEFMYARHLRMEAPPPWDLRTWHYVKHGGVLLARSGREGQGVFTRLSMNVLAVGALLRLLAALLEALEIRLEAVLHLDRIPSFILAMALGNLLERPVRSWRERSRGEELLALPHLGMTDDMTPRPVRRVECPYLFAFHAYPFREYAVLPEFLGLIAVRFRFPWEERVEIVEKKDGRTEARAVKADDRKPEEIGREIADAARLLPEDKNLQALRAFYTARREGLVCCNPDRYPERRMFHPGLGAW